MGFENRLIVPPPLFSSATKIRIGGRMPYALFRAVISNPFNLQNLHIHNPQGRGQSSDGLALYYEETDDAPGLD